MFGALFLESRNEALGRNLVIVNTFYRIYTHFLCVGMYFFQYLTERIVTHTYLLTYIHIVLHSKASYVQQKEDKPQNRQITNCVNLSSCIHHASWATMIFPISLATFTISSGLSCSASVDSSQSSAASQCRKKTLSVVVRQRAVHKFSDYHFKILFSLFVSSRVWALWPCCLPSQSLQGSAVQQLTPVSPQYLASQCQKKLCLSSSTR